MTFSVQSYREYLELERRLGMGRLSEKMAAAAAVAPRQAAKIEARADRIIAAEPEIERMTEESFSAHEAILAEAERGLGDVLHALAGSTNGAPLELSSASPESPGGRPSQQLGSPASSEPSASGDAPQKDVFHA
jgi:hypothetical protein